MEKAEWDWKSSDGLDMKAFSWLPPGAPRAVIALVHGWGDHAESHRRIAEVFQSAGYAMCGFDLRGHGKSGGKRGHIPSYEAVMEDIASFLVLVSERHPDLPVFLFGHSLGGNFALNFALRRKPAILGIIASSPWLKLAFQPSPFKLALARAMNGIFPSFTQENELDVSGLSHDPAINQSYSDDPLAHSMISARLYVSAHEAGLWAIAHAGELRLPAILLHGDVDPVTSFEASRDFARAAGDKLTFVPCPGLFHNIHDEPGNREAMATLLGWIAGRIA